MKRLSRYMDAMSKQSIWYKQGEVPWYFTIVIHSSSHSKGLITFVFVNPILAKLSHTQGLFDSVYFMYCKSNYDGLRNTLISILPVFWNRCVRKQPGKSRLDPADTLYPTLCGEVFVPKEYHKTANKEPLDKLGNDILPYKSCNTVILLGVPWTMKVLEMYHYPLDLFLKLLNHYDLIISTVSKRMQRRLWSVRNDERREIWCT